MRLLLLYARFVLQAISINRIGSSQLNILLCVYRRSWSVYISSSSVVFGIPVENNYNCRAPACVCAVCTVYCAV